MGDPLHPFIFQVQGNSILTVMNSTILHCGQYHSDPTRTGLYLEGGTHQLVNVTIQSSCNGLVLDRCLVLVEDTEITATGIGLLMMEAELELNRSRIQGNISAVLCEYSRFVARNCSLESDSTLLNISTSHVNISTTMMDAGLRAIEAANSTVSLERCNVSAGWELLWTSGSIVELWFMDIETPRGNGGTVDDGKVALYDTDFDGVWTLVDAQAEVTENWYYDISAFYRWNDVPAKGLEVWVRQEQGSGGSTSVGTIDDDGRLGRIWLVGVRWVSAGSARYSPYWSSIDTGEFRAFCTLPEDISAKVVLEVHDVVGPALEFTSPANGTIHTITTMTFQGSVQDLGSGIEIMQFSLDENLYETLENVVDGLWELTLEVVQGNNTLRVRATDADGASRVVEVWFIVDDVPPLVTFLSPEPGVAMLEDRVILKGLVVIDEGTAIVQCSVDGVEFELDTEGMFHIEALLSREGEHIFVAEVHKIL